jgi:polyisoprenyl-teichoic acid--peptidoglycan teichoic acid transferase
VVQLAPRSPSPGQGEGEPRDPWPNGHVGSSGPPPGGPRTRGRHATVLGDGFGDVVGWTLLGGLVPGLGLLRSGRRVLGGVVLGLVAIGLVGVLAFAVFGDPIRWSESVVVSPDKLVRLVVALGAVVLVWTVLVVLTHVSLRRQAHLTGLQRGACTALLVGLIAVGVLPAAKAAEYALLTRDTLVTVFHDTPVTAQTGAPQPQVEAADPWASLPRVNVLLIGSDAGADREGVRPDTMIVASIDTRTGDTVLFSLPRNLQKVPFPAGSPAAADFPGGFYCINPANGVNTDCLLNGIWTFAEAHAGDYYKGIKNPGLTATTQAAEAVTGLRMNNYVLIDLKGFKDFVNAIDGITIDVKQRLPIGGDVENPGATTGWIEPGVQKLDGYHALWYARSRWSTNDFDRMRRQRCVIGAIAQQADPVTVAENLPAILRAAKRNIQTDIALSQLDAWVQLTERVKTASMRSLPFIDGVINTADPNFTRVHQLVQRALQPTATPSPSATADVPATTPSPSRARSATPSPTSSASTRPADVRAVC